MDFKVVRNDIVNMEVDAIVLPANWKLRMGTGASMAIFEAAGREDLEAECTIRFNQAKQSGKRLVPGVSVPTLAYELPAKVILHTIVPKWNEKNPRECYENLCKSYASALVLADKMDLESIAFPLLASGNNKFDPDLAIEIALKSLEQYQPANKLSQAYLVTYDSLITQKVRAQGHEIEELIDQVHVLEQDLHQAQVWQAEKERQKTAHTVKKPLPKQVMDDAFDWLCVPENQQVLLDFALAVAYAVLPTKGTPGKVLKVLNVVTPIIKKKG